MTKRTNRIVVAVMARSPSDERGKTRLVSALGSGAGADLRCAILLDTLDIVRHVTIGDRIVLFSPITAEAEFAELTGGAERLIPQRGDSLGERLDHAFEDLFAQAYSGVLIIGSDLPTLPPAYLEHAAAELTRRVDPVVLGPALDGGYYLIGLGQYHPELFRGIPWSTNAVLDATLDAARRAGLPVTLISPWYDVDSADDLRRLLESAADGPLEPRRVRAWFSACPRVF